MKRSPEIDATVSELERHGAQVTNITTGGKHKRVYYHYQGRDRYMVVSGTGSDWRGPENARQAVRRSLGLKREKVTGERRSRKVFADRAAPTAPEHFTIKADPWKALAGTRIGTATAALAADRAWARLFGLCLREVGHVPLNPSIREASAA